MKTKAVGRPGTVRREVRRNFVLLRVELFAIQRLKLLALLEQSGERLEETLCYCGWSSWALSYCQGRG